eukprot:Gb_21046 [translate_table: standard]
MWNWNSKKTTFYFTKLIHQKYNNITFTTTDPVLPKTPKIIENFNEELRGNHAGCNIHGIGGVVFEEVSMKDTLDILHATDQRGIWVDTYPYGSILQDCINVKDLAEGKGVHAHMIKSRFEPNVYLKTKLVIFYAKCGSLGDARQLFDEMLERNSVTWNTLLAEYSRHGFDQEALRLFCEMRGASTKPDEFTFVSVLKACARLVALELGKQVHAHIIQSGFESNAILLTALIDFYAKCKCVKDARQMFDEMPLRDLVSWTAIITGYMQQGYCDEALSLFQRMGLAGLKPNEFTFRSVFRACASIGALGEGKQIHAQMILNGFEVYIVLGNALVDMYAKCGNIEDARLVYDKISQRNLISWNSMITGYSQQGLGEEALKLFYQMHMAGMKIDEFAFDSILGVCADLTSMEQGKQVHGYIIKSGFDSDVVLGSTLIDMYAKCGNIEEARLIFDIVSQKDVVLWTVMVTAYGKHGHGKEVFQLFEQMKQSGMKPDGITYLAVLSACSHAGLVDEGWHYFYAMMQDNCITPRAAHYACMVDLLGRAGQLDEAHVFIKDMPVKPNAAVWGALLNACRIHANMELGKLAAEHLFELDPQNAGNYVVLSNVYAAAAKWEDILRLRKTMKDRGIKKEPGCSWIEVKNRVHVFPVGDRSHPEIEEVYAMLQRLTGQMKNAGYLPDTNSVLNDVEEEQ